MLFRYAADMPMRNEETAEESDVGFCAMQAIEPPAGGRGACRHGVNTVLRNDVMCGVYDIHVDYRNSRFNWVIIFVCIFGSVTRECSLVIHSCHGCAAVGSVD
jgi:hypothetical protein